MQECYKSMAAILRPVTVGSAEVDILDFTKVPRSIQEIMDGIQADTYARLRIGGKTIMSDTPMEQRTNYRFVHNAHGDILIGGLGIGMVLMAIQDKPEVRSITVVENSKDVIAAVKPQLPLNDKVEVIEGDVFEYKPTRKFDCIYMDIWFCPDAKAYEEMKLLKRRYGHYLKSKSESPQRFNWCWAETYARNDYRLWL